MLKRLFDIWFAVWGILILTPLLIFLTVLVALSPGGGALFKQKRVGRYGKSFQILKFRTMASNSENEGLLTVGNDARVTKLGGLLRKFKLDELPQLFNVLSGSMSFVGPRPEVEKYVALYTAEQREILALRPGITDYASLEYFEENKLLGASANPEETYIQEVMPAKLELNRKYLERNGLLVDLGIMVKTVFRIFR